MRGQLYARLLINKAVDLIDDDSLLKSILDVGAPQEKERRRRTMGVVVECESKRGLRKLIRS
jgi:hypothetical protein